MQVAELLVNELQLGQSLNHAVQQGERPDFALMLAMLSGDVEDQAQFHFDHQAQETLFEQPQYRQQFQLPEEQPLVADEAGEQYSLAVGDVAQHQGLTAARLLQCCQSEALIFKLDDRHGLPMEVFDNLSPQTAAKYRGEESSPALADVEMDALIAQQQTYPAALVA